MAGIPRASPQVRLFLAVSALSACSTEAAGLELLEDDRFPELWQLLQEDCIYLHDLPWLVWERVAMLISAGTDAAQLRDSCFFAADIGACYLWDDSFEHR